MLQLIYITDPMCSWCYGFSPELLGFVDSTPDLQLDIVVGGLRAYNKEPMTDALRELLFSHWQQVANVSGLTFNEQGLHLADFTYDTEPVCRALLAAFQLAPRLDAKEKLAVLGALQTAFYRDGKDVTQGTVLAEVVSLALNAKGHAVSAEQFLQIWESEPCKNSTRENFLQTQRWQISGFPTLIIEHRGQLVLLANGYCKLAQLQERLQRILADTSH